MSKKPGLSIQRIRQYEAIQSQLEVLHEEIVKLAKKSPDAPINRFKVEIVNEKLRGANELLEGIHKPFASFVEFDVAGLPTASDVSVVLAQYLNSLEGWRSANVESRDYVWYWATDEGSYRAARPTRFRTSEET